MKALQVFDGKEPAMAKAWLIMNNLRKHIFKLRYPPFSLTPAIAEEIEENFMKRWDMMLTDLHYARAMLNPYLGAHMELQQNGEAKRALNRVFCRLSNPLGVGFNKEMIEYEERLGPYSLEEALGIRVANLQPYQWWSRVGGEALPKIAKRVLAFMCSASSCERNWNMYSFVHNKSQNCLGTKKAEDLVYIYTNTRLFRGRLGADPLRWYENNVFSEDENKSVDDNSDMDDGDDDDNESGGKGMEGNEPINDDERYDDEGRENIKDKDDAGVFDWNEIDAEIEQENQDRTEGVVVPEGEESDRSYSPTPCYDRSCEDIEDDENFNFGQNNNVVEYLNNEDDTVVGDDNGDNNMIARVDEVVAPIIQNSASHGRMEIGSSSNSVPTFDSKSVENADSSRRSIYVEQMDTESPSLTMARPRNVREDRGKGTICTRIIKAACATVATVIGGGREMEENVVVGVNSNQNTAIQLEKMDSGIVVIGDGTGTSRDGNSVHHILRTSRVLACKRRGTMADVISLEWPPRPHRPVLQTGVVPFEVLSVSRSIETAETSMQRGPTVIGGRLKRPRMGIEPFLHTETPGNPLTTLAVLQNRGSQVDSDASDRNAKRHKRLHSRNVDGQFQFEIWNESSEVEGLGQSQYGDQGAIMGDDEQGCDESDPDSNGDREKAPNDLDIRVRQLSVATSRRPRQSHRVRRNRNSTTNGDDSSS